MLSGPILSFYDSKKPLFVITDGSLEAIGYVIFQHGENKKCHLISCGGRSLTATERKRSITDIECGALIFAISSNHALLANQWNTILNLLKAVNLLNSQL